MKILIARQKYDIIRVKTLPGGVVMNIMQGQVYLLHNVFRCRFHTDRGQLKIVI